MSVAGCRLSIPAGRTRLDLLLDLAWYWAEECFTDPTDVVARERLRAANVLVSECRAAMSTGGVV